MADQKKASVRMFPPMYAWGSKIVTRSGRREVRKDPSRRLNRITQHLLPGPERRQASSTSQTVATVPLPELVGDFRLGRFDRKPHKQDAWKLIKINESQVWCYGGTGGAAENLIISPTAKLGAMIEFRTTADSRIIIGDGAVIGDRCILQAGIQVVISAGAKLGVGCLVMDRNHHGIGTEPEVLEPIHVGHHACIGDYSVLLAGAKVHELEQLPDHSVVSQRGPVSSLARERTPLLHAALERRIRHQLAYNLPVSTQDVQVEAALENPSTNLDLHSIMARGALDRIMLSPTQLGFYRVPWGPPMMCSIAPHRISVAQDTFIHNSSQLFANGGSISLGRYVIMSWRVLLVTSFEHNSGDIAVGDQVWVSAMSILLPGTVIGRGSVVAAGSVVSGSFPPFSIIAGHPATVKATIDPFDGAHGEHIPSTHRDMLTESVTSPS